MLPTVTNYPVEINDIGQTNIYKYFNWSEFCFRNKHTIVNHWKKILTNYHFSSSVPSPIIYHCLMMLFHSLLLFVFRELHQRKYLPIKDVSILISTNLECLTDKRCWTKDHTQSETNQQSMPALNKVNHQPRRSVMIRCQSSTCGWLKDKKVHDFVDMVDATHQKKRKWPEQQIPLAVGVAAQVRSTIRWLETQAIDPVRIIQILNLIQSATTKNVT